LAVLKELDARGLRNHVLVITRHQMKREDAGSLSELVNIKLTLLFTYSGIDDKRIEPYPSHVAAQSLKLMSAQSPRRYRTVLYWRPLVPGLNDSDEHLDRAVTGRVLVQLRAWMNRCGLMLAGQVAVR
jgi:DNA repair photolyase